MSEVTTIRVLDRPAIAHGRARAFFIYMLPLTRVSVAQSQVRVHIVIRYIRASRVEKLFGIKSKMYRNIIPVLSFTG